MTPGGSVSIRNVLVIVPTYNEIDGIGALISAVFARYPGIHILIVDDHSPDGTAGAVRALQMERPNLHLIERRGWPSFGRSYRDGFRYALEQLWCRAVVMMDADLSHDPADIAALVAALDASGAAIGSRYTRGGGVEQWSLRRELLSRFANLYVRAVLRLPVADATAGFVAIRREYLQRLRLEELRAEGYAFQVDLKHALLGCGCRIAEHPITFHERRQGKSKMSGRKIWESIWLPWRIRFSPRRGASCVWKQGAQEELR